VFRLYDTRTRQVAEIDPGAGRLLRLQVRGPAPDRPADVGDLRSLLVADLIRRNAEHRHNLTVWASLVVPSAGNDAAGAYHDAFAADATALNIRTAEQTATGAMSPGEILIGEQPGPAADHEAVQHSVIAGPVTFEGRETGGSAGNPAPAAGVSGLAERGLDPLAARLAFMSRPYAEPANLTWDVLAQADQALGRWRDLVAEWAESPSRPMCAEVTGQVAAAFDGDLDTPAALRALRDLAEDPQIPPGSKFESFLRADQLLALDLPREIGRPRRG
jgi:cysteinyl-tRNA synthetase